MSGYAESIVQVRRGQCYLCGYAGQLVRHEPLQGLGRREKSKHSGLWVELCVPCHETAHGDIGVKNALKADCQRAAMTEYGWTTEQFIWEFGKNYLEE